MTGLVQTAPLPLLATPPAELFLGIVLALGAVAPIVPTISWLTHTQLDKVLLAFAAGVGAVGFGLTEDLALLFAPSTAVLAWLAVRSDVGSGAVIRRMDPRSGGEGGAAESGGGGGRRGPGGEGGGEDDTALAPGDLEAVAEATEGFSIRDVRHLAGRVAREALRREERVTTKRLVEEAVEPTLADWQPERSTPTAHELFEPL